MHIYIKLLSDISYMVGLIGWPEYVERCEVAEWIGDTTGKLTDPRLVCEEQNEYTSEENCHPNEGESASARLGNATSSGSDDSSIVEFLILNKWMFTIGDRDCYPSVPHGHLKCKTRPWPKLNPYTGKVFSSKDREDISQRLTKLDMKNIWNNSDFLDHCREQVLWYSEFASNYCFPNARRGRLIFPHWR